MINCKITKKNTGFTLIELMVAIVIVAVLAAVASASYRSYIVKSRRQAAQEDLLTMQQSLEEYYSLKHRYTDNDGNLQTGNNGNSSGFYNAEHEHVNGYKLCLVATGSQQKDEEKETKNGENCSKLCLERNGKKTPSHCW